MARALAYLVGALLIVGCARVPGFEEGSTEATVAALIAEWGPGEYRGILDARDCEALEGWRDSIERWAETVPDTPQWREEQGSREALAIREEQLGCSAS
jgi:hypothetical protein